MTQASKNSYSIEGLIKLLVSNGVKGIHTSIPCVIEMVNNDGTINATPAIKDVLVDDGEEVTLPTITNIPVIFQSSSTYVIQFPLEVGDEGILLFQEKEISQFKNKGEITRPKMFRKHNLSDAVFIPAMISDSKRVSPDPSKGLVIGEPNGARIEIKNGVINLFGLVNFETIPGSGSANVSLNTHVHLDSTGSPTQGPISPPPPQGPPA